jgi:hypothetical protein
VSVAATVTGIADATGGNNLHQPQDMACGPNRNLHIADTFNDRILGYTLSS